MMIGNKLIDSVFLFYFSIPGFWFQLFQEAIFLRRAFCNILEGHRDQGDFPSDEAGLNLSRRNDLTLIKYRSGRLTRR